MQANPAWQGYPSETNERQVYRSELGISRELKAAITA